LSQTILQPLNNNRSAHLASIPCLKLTTSYAALGLLPSIPLPKNPSAKHRVALPFGSDGMDVDAAPVKATFGRIIRDEAGNVIDIIIDEDDEEKAEENKEETNGWKAYAEESVVERVEAKTQVVKGMYMPSHKRLDRIARFTIRALLCCARALARARARARARFQGSSTPNSELSYAIDRFPICLYSPADSQNSRPSPPHPPP
jgi:hypothetical protein